MQDIKGGYDKQSLLPFNLKNQKEAGLEETVQIISCRRGRGIGRPS